MIDFGISEGTHNWRTLNDSVMGGLSYSRLTVTDTGLKITGAVSLENNGGFSSIRSSFENYDLAEYSNLVLRCRGKGQTFSFTLETDRRWYYPYYKASIPLPDENWHEVKIPLSDFKKYRVGRTNDESISTSLLDDIIRLGIVTNSKQAGEFEFELDYIYFE